MRHAGLVALLFILSPLPLVYAQSDLSTLAGYDHYQQVAKTLRELSGEGRVSNVKWSSAGDSVQFRRQGAELVVRFEDMTVTPYTAGADEPGEGESAAGGGGRDRLRGNAARGPGRAQQSTVVVSPDGKWKACHSQFNVVLEQADQADSSAPADTSDPPAEPAEKRAPAAIEVTTSGTEDFRYGTACWVYGEELFQASAMWWSPDSRKLAFYEIDERHMKEYYLTVQNTKPYTEVQVERYPLAGDANPYVGLLVYDLESKLTTRIDVGGDLQQYVYNVRFSPDGKELLFSRTNRRQDRLEVVAADPQTGITRLVLTEQQPTWQENRPLLQFLADGQRFIWETERSGWKRYELRHLDGRLLNALSAEGAYPVESVLRVDEQADAMFYSAFSDANPNNAQLHRVRLDGSEHVLLTRESLHHSGIEISPDNKWFVACREAVDRPPVTALYNQCGEQVAVLAESDMQKAQAAGMSYGELFSFKSADGSTDLYGILHKPTHFDPTRKYPLLISVYGGPSSRGIWNRFVAADPNCEFGYVIATIANRGTTGRGKAFETATYLGLGGLDLQDQADGVRFLCQRTYVDAQRVGIYGHSYGGYMTALALVKFPDVFHVGVAGAPVTDWRNYDTIYTERYMRTPAENPEGYRDGSCLTHADKLTGRLLLMHGLVDDNVHPANTWQLIDVLQRKNIRFDMLIYPQSKHGLSSNSNLVRWEYLTRHLRPEPLLWPEG